MFFRPANSGAGFIDECQWWSRECGLKALSVVSDTNIRKGSDSNSQDSLGYVPFV
jgi:hypothetical protein